MTIVDTFARWLGLTHEPLPETHDVDAAFHVSMQAQAELRAYLDKVQLDVRLKEKAMLAGAINGRPAR